MSLNVKVPRELTEYKEKVVGGLTLRQIICFGIAAVVGLPAYFLARAHIGNEPASYVLIFITVPCGAFALIRKNDLPLEKYLVIAFRHRFLTPKKRVYTTENIYDILIAEEEKYEQLQAAAAEQNQGRKKKGKGAAKSRKEDSQEHTADFSFRYDF